MYKSFFILFFILFSFASCSVPYGQGESIRGSKKMVVKSYDDVDFSEIDASNVFSVTLTQGDTYNIELSCNENILEYVSIVKEGNELVLKLKSFNSFEDISVKVNITVPTIEKIRASGASKVKMKSFILDQLELDLSGASTFKGAVRITNLLEIEASGASTVKIKGKAKNANFEISGASNLKAKDFIVQEELVIDASGASSCSVTSRGTLEMESSGASSINYYGVGKVLQMDESGAGSIKKKYKV